jgi:hypothetical protein
MGWLWHCRLADVGMKNLHELLKEGHILALTDVHFEKDRICSTCQARKQVGVHHPHKNIMTTERPLELLHMDLFSQIAYISIDGSKYCPIIVDDYSRFTWVFFLQEKYQTQETLKKFLRRAQNEFRLRIKIRSDNGTEFKNSQIEGFLEEEKSAFLNGPIKEEVYFEQPPDFEDSEYPTHVYKLSKALYGLKQALRAWYECLRDFLLTNGFKVGRADPTIFTKTIDKDLFICQIYVDDIIFGSTNKSSCEEFSGIMIQKFEMSMMGELKYFLGFQIKQLQEGTFICQTRYIKNILKKFGMKNAKPIKTPMGTNGHLDLDTGGKSVDQKVYRSMIGSLLYLCASRPDIMLSICMCARFQANIKEVHLRAVKRIMRYLVYTPKFGLWYPQGFYL